jgi:hypothetical protein
MLTSLWLQLPERYIWPSSVWGPTRHTYKHFNEALRFYWFFADFLGIKNVRCFRGNHTEVIVKHTSVVFDTSDCGCVLLSVTSIGKVYKLTHARTYGRTGGRAVWLDGRTYESYIKGLYFLLITYGVNPKRSCYLFRKCLYYLSFTE